MMIETLIYQIYMLKRMYSERYGVVSPIQFIYYLNYQRRGQTKGWFSSSVHLEDEFLLGNISSFLTIWKIWCDIFICINIFSTEVQLIKPTPFRPIGLA